MTDESTLSLEPEEFLIHEGDDSSQMFFLQSGTMAVFKRKGDATIQIGTIYSGEVVGEMSFLDKEQRSASVKAISDCVLTVIPSEKFEKTLNSLPAWYKALVHTLLDRLRRANQRIRV